MAWAFITSDQLRNRLSSTLFKRLLDDNRDGVGDEKPIAQLIADASGKVASYLNGVLPLAAVNTAVQAGEANEVVRITLDVAEYMAIKRHPDCAPGHDWEALMKAANTDLKMLRQSDVKLDTESSPNPPANVGGTLHPEQDSDADKRQFNTSGFGDFG